MFYTSVELQIIDKQSHVCLHALLQHAIQTISYNHMHVFMVRRAERMHVDLEKVGQMCDAKLFIETIQAFNGGLGDRQPADELWRIVFARLKVVQGVDELRIQFTTQVVRLRVEQLMKDLKAVGRDHDILESHESQETLGR